MKHLYTTAMILSIITAVGIFYLLPQRGDYHFKDFEYEPEDWVATSHTMFSTDLSNRTILDKYCFNWQALPKGTQLKPIVRYYSDYVVVELPDGRRGVVVPSTLSGTVRDGNFDRKNYGGQLIEAKIALKHKITNNKATDSTCVFIGYMTGKEHYEMNKRHNKGKAPENYGLPYLIIKNNGKYFLLNAIKIWPNFAKEIPVYNSNHNDEFKIYVSSEQLAKMSRKEIDNQYGEPVSVTTLLEGGQKAFYRHLRTKQSYNYQGIFINYNIDETTVVENPELNTNKHSLSYITNNSRPLLSQLTSIDWVDMPLAFSIIQLCHLNFSDISLDPVSEKFPYLWVFFGSIVFSIIIIYTLTSIIAGICFPIKFLSNGSINLIAVILPIIPTLVISTLYMELFQNLWIVISLATIIIVLLPFFWISNKTEYHRCNYCRNLNCVTYTSTLIDTKVSTRVDTRDYNDTSTDYDWSGDKKTKTVIHKRDHELIETTNKKYRYDFHCSHCNRNWQTINTESKDRTLDKKTTSHGGTITTYTKR